MTKMSHIKRDDYLLEIEEAFQVTPVCAVLGPRQCGKTTLAKEVGKRYDGPVFTFDLEDDRDLEKLAYPLLALSGLEGLIIIDGAHLLPHLFKSLRVLVDEKKNRRFLILSFSPPHLLQKTSQSLAGRITYIEIMPFSIGEIEEDDRDDNLWIRGGFPKAFLSKTHQDSWEWRRSYIKDFFARDILTLGFKFSPQVIHRLWPLLAQYHDQNFNASQFSRSLMVMHKFFRSLDAVKKTIWSYLDILEAYYMIRRLNPWVSNIRRREVKSPKVYFRDTGILHSFLNIQTYEDLINHPKLESSWRGYAMEQVIRHHRAEPEDCYYWKAQNGAEMDLLIIKEGKKIGYMFEYRGKLRKKSMGIALKVLELDHLFLVTPGTHSAFSVQQVSWIYKARKIIKIAKEDLGLDYLREVP